MVPYYTLAIDICVRGLTDADNVWMRRTSMVPFIPMNGISIELWCEGDENNDDAVKMVELQGVYYSTRESQFIEEQVDDEMYDKYRAGDCGTLEFKEYLKQLERFGFKVLRV